MPTPAEIVRETHRLRRHLHELGERVKQAPYALKAQQAKLARQEEALKQAQEALKHTKVLIHQKEVSIKAAQDQIKKYEKQLKEMITNKKEYDALSAEIKQTKDTIAKLEDETLEAIGASDEQTAKLPEIDQATKKAKADFAQFEKDQAERLQRFADDKVKAQAELKAVEATLPPETRQVYDRLILAKGADAMAAVHGLTCAACYTEVTAQMSSELSRGLFVVCKNCGRVLYQE